MISYLIYFDKAFNRAKNVGTVKRGYRKKSMRSKHDSDFCLGALGYPYKYSESLLDS